MAKSSPDMPSSVEEWLRIINRPGEPGDYSQPPPSQLYHLPYGGLRPAGSKLGPHLDLLGSLRPAGSPLEPHHAPSGPLRLTPSPLQRHRSTIKVLVARTIVVDELGGAMVVSFFAEVGN